MSYPPNYDRWPNQRPIGYAQIGNTPPPPPKSGRGKLIFAAVAGVLLLVALCAGLFAAQGKPENHLYKVPAVSASVHT